MLTSNPNGDLVTADQVQRTDIVAVDLKVSEPRCFWQVFGLHKNVQKCSFSDAFYTHHDQAWVHREHEEAHHEASISIIL
jgi:hypothetical protein